MERKRNNYLVNNFSFAIEILSRNVRRVHRFRPTPRREIDSKRRINTDATLAAEKILKSLKFEFLKILIMPSSLAPPTS